MKKSTVGGLVVAVAFVAMTSCWGESEYTAGVRDIRGGQMPSGSVPCHELPETLVFEIERRRASGLTAERIRGQVEEKYRIVMRECRVATALLWPLVQEVVRLGREGEAQPPTRTR